MERNNNNFNSRREAQPNSMAHLRDLFLLCANHWQWFVLSLLVCMGGAVYYLLKTPKVYTCSTSVLIKSEESKSGMENQLQEIGITQTSSNMVNEIQTMSTTSISAEIVQRLNLDVNYLRDGLFHPEVAYGVNLPVTVHFEGLDDGETASLRLTLNPDSTLLLSQWEKNDQEFGGELSMRLGQTASLPIGKVTVTPSPYYYEGASDRLHIVRGNKRATIASVRSRISANLRDKNSTIIDILYKDVSTDRAKDVLNTLVAVYNENWIKDRNRISISTSEFIKERLGVIEQELGNVDQDISSYKSEHLVPDVQQVGAVAMSQATEADMQSRTIDNQLYMARYIRNYLLDEQHSNQLLPSNSGINNTSIEQQIGEYNELLLKRNKHLAMSSAQNPLVMDLDENLSVMRRAIIHSLDNELTMLQTQQRAIQNTQTQATARIAANPMQAQYLLSVERQQKVKESLYLFLLQKREENELSQAFTAYNTRIIEAPQEGGAPTVPSGTNILLIAFAVGLLVPGSILFVRDSLNVTVRGRKDLEQLKAPFVGEIPLAARNQKKPKKGEKTKLKVLVEEKNRDIINEAFRVVRTNLEFMLGYDETRRVVMLTSINPNSGKTFISMNLATTFAIKGKKVIVIDLDMRKATLSDYIDNPRQGVSNYLSGQLADYQPLIMKYGELDVLPCGTIPPNPTELLYSTRFTQLLEDLKRQYDYIFIDCPPVEIVADVSIVNPQADLTLFVIRAHLLDRSFLPEIESWYEGNRYKNLSIILNGTTEVFNRYGYHKYGSHYGYYRYGEYKSRTKE